MILPLIKPIIYYLCTYYISVFHVHVDIFTRDRKVITINVVTLNYHFRDTVCILPLLNTA